MDHVRAGLSTVMASQGQRFMQMPHRMHASTLLVTWPLRPGGGVFCSTGYWMVSGLPNSDFERHLSQFERSHVPPTFPCS